MTPQMAKRTPEPTPVRITELLKSKVNTPIAKGKERPWMNMRPIIRAVIAARAPVDIASSTILKKMAFLEKPMA